MRIPPELCRHAATAIAPSLHNVILKAFLRGVEPLAYKGGRLCAIWKQKQSSALPSSYRGILLANVYGTVLHAWARQRLLPTLIGRRAPGQIGGLLSQQTSTAMIQLLKLHGRQGRAKKLSTAVIFVDLRSHPSVPDDIPSGLRVFLDDIHKSTWFKLDADQEARVTQLLSVARDLEAHLQILDSIY
eukprot:s753_g23.t1